jgi:hypothetical protein
MLLAGVLASAAYAFTASNTVPGTTAGQGSQAISGYTASSVAYNLNATTPSNIDSVAFTLSPAAAATVKIQVVSGGSWYSCTNTAGSVSCATTSPQATVSAADNLTVLAVQ